MKRIAISSVVRSSFFYVFQFFFLLGFLLEYPIVGLITSRRICLIVAIILLLSRKRLNFILSCINVRNHIRFILLFCLCIFISYIHISTIAFKDDGYSRLFEIRYFFFIYLYVFVFGLYCAVVFKSFKRFAFLWISIILFESISVFLAVSSNVINVFFYMLFPGDGRFEMSADHGSRIIGFGIMGSMGSIIMSTGCLVLALSKHIKIINSFVFYLLYVVFVAATVFIGRTGVILEVAILFFFSIIGERLKGFLIFIIISAIALITILIILGNMDSLRAEGFQKWMTGAITEESRSRTFETLYGTGIAPFSLDMIWGLGVMRGRDQYGVYHITDSGYIMTYTAIGIVGFVAFYLGLLFLLLIPKTKNIKFETKYLFYILILIAYFIEIKEAYFLKYIYTWVLFTSMLLFAVDKEKARMLNTTTE